ncbi:energy transducer TonB [Hymenobacter norwichensis]|uniref:energy transducer TonB n=1 Tax=Hymenobacter norwichensis TaxID=223903 RepID=UPI000403BABE|nr:energy transducer TonB [Hymenobacter norwichensis]
MLDLPILNVRLNACHEDWQQMTPVEQGHHCTQCNRTVIDFTSRTQTDLKAAFQTSPDGRICGRFRQSQLAPTPQLRPKLRRFLVALVLVCGLGLTRGEAWAQKATHTSVTQKPSKPLARKALKTPAQPQTKVIEQSIGIVAEPAPNPNAQQVYGYVEQMPVYKNGGTEGLIQFIQKNVRWPAGSGMLDAEGKVFIGFVVDKTGRVRDATVLKGIFPSLDAEALRVIQMLDGQFEPGRQNKMPVDVRYTVPVIFKRD